MEKHQLIKHAYDNYPKGTKFISTWSGDKYISTGVFAFSDDYQDIYCVGLEEKPLVYDRELKLWAEIIPEKQPSILDGKVDIQVNNDREFKLVMDHFNVKGWKQKSGNSLFCSMNKSYPFYISYQDGFSDWKYTMLYDIPITIISFSDFAKEVGIKVPVFIMKSEDGVDLYEGDEQFVANNDEENKWFLLKNCRPIMVGDEKSIWLHTFSTREAAEKWIEEHNKPKQIKIELKNGYACIEKNKFELVLETGDGLSIEGEDLKKAFNAYQSLQ